METYLALQHYWWFLVSLLGALLVFLLFVQGGQSFIFTLGLDSEDRRMMVNSTGRKWEYTFTTLVTFGGAFFASFPYFYAVSFSGAYWVWMLILFCFVIQAISYEYQNKKGNVWGSKTYQIFLFINGVLGPILLGTAVATLFTGGNFILNRDAMVAFEGNTTMSSWVPFNGIQLHGLEAVLNPWNVVLGLAVFFLARVSGLLYFLNNIVEPSLQAKARKQLLPNAVLFLVFFLLFLGFLLTTSGYAYDPVTKVVSLEKFKFFNNLMAMPYLIASLLVGVVLVLYGMGKSIFVKDYNKGIWFHGVGVVLTVLTLLLLAGWNNTCYYPSIADPQSSLTIENSSSSPFTLKAMSYVSILIPFVLAYIFYAWRQLDFHKIDKKSINKGVNY